MTANQLLIPRYIVIDNYPDSPFKVGDIITYVREVAQAYDQWEIAGKQFTSNGINKYPNIFRKLNWWEHREKHELPQYVLWTKTSNKAVSRVTTWTYSDHYGWYFTSEAGGSCKHIPNECHIIPATPDEYDTYMNQIK
jgi:hypothetical protein